MKNTIATFYLLIFLACAVPASASGPDPLVGVRISLLGMQSMLASPPLPSLDANSNGELTVQGGYMSARVDDPITVTNGPVVFTQNAKGSFHGYSLGVGVTSSAKKTFGLYAFVDSDTLNGELDLTVTGAPFTIALSKMKNSGTTFATGVSYRLPMGTKSPLQMGFFAGPYYSQFKSEFQVVSSASPSTSSTYSASPTTYGLMAGAQVGLQLAMLNLNPYIIYYKDLTNGCKSYSADTQIADGSCPGTTNTIKLQLSFVGYGLNVGIYDFNLTVFSKAQKDSSLSSISLTDYSVDYSFKF